jgi:hypothetical protein
VLTVIKKPDGQLFMRAEGAAYHTLRVAFLLLCLLFVARQALALDPTIRITQYGHDVWQLENGLPQNSVRDITVTVIFGSAPRRGWSVSLACDLPSLIKQIRKSCPTTWSRSCLAAGTGAFGLAPSAASPVFSRGFYALHDRGGASQ